MTYLKAVINRIKNLFTSSSHGSSIYELKNFLCGIGSSEILADEIKIKQYPFKPSIVYPNYTIQQGQIDALSWESYPPLLMINDEVIFISRAHSEKLEQFAEQNHVPIFEPSYNWHWILEPYLDTEYTKDKDLRLTKLLNENGISVEEIATLRAEVREQMLKYNFDTMLLEWGGLGLEDVLAAMRVKYNDQDFRDFYLRAMEIQMRTE